MSETLSIIDLLETARLKLGGITAYLNDSKKFAHAVTDFDSWLAAHSQQLSSASELDQTTREHVADILRQLTRLELQARHNANLVGDMQSYLREDNPAENYPPKSVATTAHQMDSAASDDTASVAATGDAAPLARQNPMSHTPAAQIYAKQNQAIHQASQE